MKKIIMFGYEGNFNSYHDRNLFDFFSKLLLEKEAKRVFIPFWDGYRTKHAAFEIDTIGDYPFDYYQYIGHNKVELSEYNPKKYIDTDKFLQMVLDNIKNKNENNIKINEMNFCPCCGEKLNKQYSYKYCSFCGKKLI